MEAEIDVRVVQVYLKCPDCDDIMKNSEISTELGLYRYECQFCKSAVLRNNYYPYTKYIKK